MGSDAMMQAIYALILPIEFGKVDEYWYCKTWVGYHRVHDSVLFVVF